MKNKLYEERLRILKLTKLVERRFRGDMIETYKIINRKEDIDPDKLFTIRPMRGDPAIHRGSIIFKPRNVNNREPRKNSFTQRVVNPYNHLKKEEVQAPTTGGFKRNFGKNENEFRRNFRNGRACRLYESLYMVNLEGFSSIYQ